MLAVTGSEIAVLSLLIVAFAAGWFSRGGREARGEPVADALAEAEEALSAAVAAYREGWNGVALAIEEARAEQDRLVSRLGAEHPCARDYDHALGALEVLASSGGGSVRRALEGVVDDACARYALGAAAIAALPAD